MIPQKVEYEVLSNAKNETDFKLAASGSIFQLLSDKIYTHKISAVIRELCCNAYDSHVAAGKRDTPFKIQLPNQMHEYFEVEDFGVGLSHDEVIEIYSVYGLSTKTNTNDQIGSMGIGSKSPFCYSKTFSVITRKDGSERVYNAYIGSDGNPKINLIFEKQTREQNGTKVIVPVPYLADQQKFVDETSFISSFFDPLPEVVGKKYFTFYDESVSQTLSDKGFSLAPVYGSLSSLYQSRLYAVMGHVCYAVNRNSFENYVSNVDEDSQEIVNSILSNNSVFVEFEMGSISFNAGREQIEYNDQCTEDFVYETIYKKFKDIIQQYQDELNQCDSISEVLNFYERYFSGSGYTKSLKLKYRGKNLMKIIRKSLFALNKNVQVYKYVTNRKTGDKRNHIDLYDVSGYPSVDVVYRNKGEAKTRTRLVVHELLNFNNQIVLYLEKPLTEHYKKRLQTLLLNKANFINAKEYIDQNFEAIQQNRTVIKKDHDIVPARYYYNYERYNLANHKINDPSVYVWIEKDKFSVYYLDKYSELLSGMTVLSANSRNMDAIQRNKIKHVEQHIKDTYAELYDSIKSISFYMSIKDHYSHRSNIFIDILRQADVYIDHILESKKFYEENDKLVFAYRKHFKQMKDLHELELTDIDFMNIIHNRYPLLSCMSLYELEGTKDSAIEYIKLINMKNEVH